LKLPFELRGGLLLAANTFLVLILAFPVQVLVARYLGPTQLGVYTYVLSFANLARVFVSMSMQDVLVPLYRRDPNDSLLGSAWMLRQWAAVGVTLSVAAWSLTKASWGETQETQLGLMILVVVGAYLFSDHEIYSIWCKCEGRFKDLVAVDFGGTMVGLALRLGVVYSGASMVALLWTYLWEQVAKLLLATALYVWRGRPFLRPIRGSAAQARWLFLQGWPIWVSALLTVAYARLDQLLLGSLVADPSQLGQYSVALRIVDALGSGSVALFVVYLPILSANQEQKFGENLQRYHDLAVITCGLLMTPLVFTLRPLVLKMYGASYSQAADLSLLYLWTLPVVYLNLCRAAFLYTQGGQKLELRIKLFSLTASLTLNMYLIPRYGASGSVLASLVVQWTTLIGSYLFVSALRPAGACALRSAFLPGAFWRLRSWLGSGGP
jgi:PST family polysaccharide transporter